MTGFCRFSVVLCGCVCSLLAYGASAQQASAPGPSAPIQVYDGFEGQDLSPDWERSRFAPGAFRIQHQVVRLGHGAAEIIVHAHDMFEAGEHGDSDSERAELLEARKYVSRQDVAYETSFSLLSRRLPIVPTRLVVAQWRQFCPETAPCQDQSPVLAVRYIDGALSITQDLGGKFIEMYRTQQEFRGRWLDFRFVVRFTPNERGKGPGLSGREAGRRLQRTDGQPGRAGDRLSRGRTFYFKMGLHRNVMAASMTMYLDEYRKRTVAME